MKKINALILDLGVVIINIEPERTLKAFQTLGFDINNLHDSLPIFTQFETGQISEQDFLSALKSLSRSILTDQQIIDAWNAMLLDIPADRFKLINELRKYYRVYLLSNTNAIHIRAITDYIEHEHPHVDWENTFDKIYLSHAIKLRKPDAACYQFVLNDLGIAADETIFVDDSKANIIGAEMLGIKGILTDKGIDNWLWQELKKQDTDLQIR